VESSQATTRALSNSSPFSLATTPAVPSTFTVRLYFYSWIHGKSSLAPLFPVILHETYVLTLIRAVLTHPANETTVLKNNTISGLYSSKTSHVGQIFFDQDLITKVNENSPYSTNTQTLTTNADDSILSEEAETIDPFMEYVLLGDDVSDGIFAWISVGVDSTEDTSVTPAAYYTEQGGVENESSGSGGGSGGSGSPPGASASGPSGSRPTSA
jgi:hypothetical protein